MPLFLTYDNQGLQDGFGAQSLRIMGVYSLSKIFHIRYIHSPILNVIEEFSHGFTSDNLASNLRQEVNRFFHFPSSKFKRSREILTINLKEISLKKLMLLKIKHSFSRKNIVIRILLPFTILDKYPRFYDSAIRHLKEINSFSEYQIEKNIVVHVRWGYGWKYSDSNFVHNRLKFLPFRYYSDILKATTKELNISTGHKIVVHTDLSEKQITWVPNQIDLVNRSLNDSASLQGESITIEGYNLTELISFPNGYEREIKYCSPFFETFLEMCNASYLVMGTSAFSYIAGLLNQNTVIWPDSHGHSKRNEWYSSRELGVPISREDMSRADSIAK